MTVTTETRPQAAPGGSLGRSKPRWGERVIEAEKVPQSWAGTAIDLPRSWRGLPLHDLLGDAEVTVNDGRLSLAPLLSRSPVALLSTG